jgi:hypothetical protein
MRRLIALSLGTCLGLAGVLSGCSDGSNSASTNTAGGSGAGGTTSASNLGGGAQGGNTAVTSTLTPGTGPVAIGDLAHEVSIAVCNLLQSCLVGSSLAKYYGATTQCLSQIEPSATDQLVSQLTAAIARGTATYNGSAARTCLDSYAQLDCDYSNEQALLAKCSGAWPGSIATGGSCVSNLECSGSMTAAVCASDGTCPGQCQARSALGQNCKSDDDCQLGLKCSSKTDVCVPGLKIGDPCVSGDDTNGACNGMTQCVQDLNSNQYHCSRLSAAVGLSEGQICDSMLSCDGSLICTATGELTDASSSNVFRCQKPVSSGGACRYAIGNACPDGEYCPMQYSDVATGGAHCTAQVAPNQTCQGLYAYECQNSGRCSITSKKCILRQRIGGTCETNGDCFSNVCTNSVCVAPQDCSR